MSDALFQIRTIVARQREAGSQVSELDAYQQIVDVLAKSRQTEVQHMVDGIARRGSRA